MQRIKHQEEVLREKFQSVFKEFFKKPPLGVKYDLKSKDESQNSCSSTETVFENNPNVVRAGDFIIDIDMISMDDLKKMRLLIPKKEYNSVKNRKSSRLNRMNQKIKNQSTQQECERLKKLNAVLKSKITAMKNKIEVF